MSNFLEILRERVIVYDGAMGTNIQVHAPTVDDYWGKEGCNELLVLAVRILSEAFTPASLRLAAM